MNLLEVIGEHVVLRKAGGNYVGLCPFHSERTPSFSVSESRQLYHCYGCKRGGDLISFIMEVLGVSFPEAIEELSERSRVPLPGDWHGGTSDDPEVEKRRVAQREKLGLAFKLNRFAAAFFHQTLGNSTPAIQYFMQRGVDEELGKEFYLGAVSDSWDSLAQHLKAKNAPLDLAVEIGLIRPSTKPGMGSGYFDLFRNRTLFPILNLRGKVAGFGGRVLSDDTPKYLNSSESMVFQKSKLAFGLYQAQRYIREMDEVILVEGYFDVLAMHGAGFKNAVATCGTSLTPDHLAQFNRLASKVTVLFDGDKAGVSATERAMVTGLEFGGVLYGAKMPEGLDPDEIVLGEGKERMAAILQAAKPILDEKVEELIRFARHGSEERTQALKQIGGWLAKFKDPLGKEVRIQKVQKEMGVSKQLILQAMGEPINTARSPQKIVPEVRPAQMPVGPTKMNPGDKILLAGLAIGGEYSQIFSQARGRLPGDAHLSDLFDYLPARQFMSDVLSKAGILDQLRNVPEAVIHPEMDAQVRSSLTEALVSTTPAVMKEDFERALNKSLARIWARFSHRIKQAIAEAEIKQDTILLAKLMKEYLDVQHKMKEFNNFYDEE